MANKNAVSRMKILSLIEPYFDERCNNVYIKFIHKNMNMNIQSYENNEPNFCISLPNELDELFFSFHYLNTENYHTKNYNLNDFNLYRYHSLLKGIYYDELILIFLTHQVK